MLRACWEAANTNYIVFGLTWTGLTPMIYCNQGEYDNHYTIDALWDIHYRVEIGVPFTALGHLTFIIEDSCIYMTWSSCHFIVTVEQELLTLPENLSSHPVFCGVCVAQSLVFLVVFCIILFFHCPFSIGHLSLSFFYLRLLIIHLVSSDLYCIMVSDFNV